MVENEKEENLISLEDKEIEDLKTLAKAQSKMFDFMQENKMNRPIKQQILNLQHLKEGTYRNLTKKEFIDYFDQYDIYNTGTINIIQVANQMQHIGFHNSQIKEFIEVKMNDRKELEFKFFQNWVQNLHKKPLIEQNDEIEYQQSEQERRQQNRSMLILDLGADHVASQKQPNLLLQAHNAMEELNPHQESTFQDFEIYKLENNEYAKWKQARNRKYNQADSDFSDFYMYRLNKQNKKARDNRNKYRIMNENDVFRLSNKIKSKKSEQIINTNTNQKINKEFKIKINAFGVKTQNANKILSSALKKNQIVDNTPSENTETLSDFNKKVIQIDDDSKNYFKVYNNIDDYFNQ